MPTEQRPLKVFLCHAHSDREPVQALYSRLKREGVDVWLDKEKLLPGADWELEIRKAVREADVVVVCLSKQFNQAGFRQKEVRLALDTAMEKPEGEIFIIPARLDDCENLESLNKWHWVNLFEDDGYPSLVRALRARADRIGVTLRRRGKKSVTKKTAFEKSPEPLVPDSDMDNSTVTNTPVIQSSYEAERNSEEDDAQEYKEPLKIEAGVPEQASPQETQAVEQGAGKYDEKPTKDKEEETSIVTEGPTQPEPISDAFEKVRHIVTGLLTSGKEALKKNLAKLLTSSKSVLINTIPLIKYVFIIGIILGIVFLLVRLGPLASLLNTPSLTPTDPSPINPTPTEIPYPLEATDAKGTTVMRLVIEGNFLRGNNSYPDESPRRTVYLETYYIDKYEVSNLFYKACVDNHECVPPKDIRYYSDPKYQNHPVVYVDWNMANTYCSWRGNGTRLPTEGEWEKAAGGTAGWTYPWGYKLEPFNANYGDGVGTLSVNAFPRGKSPYEVYNMAGNVREWVLDWYDAYPESDLSGFTDFGEKFRVLRGGAWDLDDSFIRVANRDYARPTFSDNDIGFRCARSVP